MRIYEELFIVKPDAPDEEVDQFVEQLRTQLTNAGATVDKVDKWGKRRLAYKVDKYREGTYVLFQFTAGPEMVREFERRLRVADLVLKFITVGWPSVAARKFLVMGSMRLKSQLVFCAVGGSSSATASLG